MKKIKTNKNKSAEFINLPKKQYNYNDPSFFNKNNIIIQKNSLITIFNRNKSSRNNKLIQTESFPSYNLSYFPTITTEKSFEKINNMKKISPKDLKYYNKIFKIPKMNLWKKKPNTINNLLNIKYSENEKEYKKITEKENLKRIENKEMTKNYYIDKLTQKKINFIKKKLEFIKSIENFALPSFFTEKIRSFSNNIKTNKNNNILSPIQKRILESKIRENERNIFLSETITINDNKK